MLKKLLKFIGVEYELEFFDDSAWSCKRKVRYGHKETAERAVTAMKIKGSKYLEAYKCRYCGGWHIGGAF